MLSDDILQSDMTVAVKLLQSFTKMTKWEKNRSRLAEYGHYLFFLCIALLVLGPLLKPGYILTLDSIFGPNFRINTGNGLFLNTIPLSAIKYRF